MLCGSGTSGCHGAFHGSAYTDAGGRRWTPEDVRRAIGREIARRPEIASYVLAKLGDTPGRFFLERIYYLGREEIV